MKPNQVPFKMFKLKKKTLKCFINFLGVLEVRPSVHCMVRQIPGLSLLFQPLDVINLISNHALNSLLGHFFHSKDIYDRKFSGSNFCFLHLIAFFYLMSIDKKKVVRFSPKLNFPRTLMKHWSTWCFHNHQIEN